MDALPAADKTPIAAFLLGGIDKAREPQKRDRQFSSVRHGDDQLLVSHDYVDGRRVYHRSFSALAVRAKRTVYAKSRKRYSGADAVLSDGKYCIGSTGAEFFRISK
jgi:hypothetical protein